MHRKRQKQLKSQIREIYEGLTELEADDFKTNFDAEKGLYVPKPIYIAESRLIRKRSPQN